MFLNSLFSLPSTQDYTLHFVIFPFTWTLAFFQDLLRILKFLNFALELTTLFLQVEWYEAIHGTA